jgi:copper(I)-binding protein
MRRLVYGLVVTCLAVHYAMAATPASSLVVETARAVASLPGSDSAVIYVTVRNDGARADRLIAASTPAAAMVHLHAGKMTDGISSMRPTEGFDVPAHARLQLRVGGDHLMLMGLPHPLQAGTTLALTLTFKYAADLQLLVPVVTVTGN